jgi:predicted transporter
MTTVGEVDAMEMRTDRVRWDVVAGAAIVALALVFLVVGSRMSFGSLRHMGPGFVPVCAALMLIGLGGFIAWEGLRKEPTSADLPKLRAFAVVVACPIVFSAMIGWAGMVPTVIVTALLARAAEPLKWGWDLVLVPLGLVVLAVGVFIEFVGVAIPIF